MRYKKSFRNFFIPSVLILALIYSYGCSTTSIKKVTHSEEERIAQADELHRKGLLLYDKGKYTEAIDAWLKEIELAPERVKPYNNIGLTYRKTRRQRVSYKISRASHQGRPEVRTCVLRSGTGI
jgi:tetratricopeptide (TPR) repeat protein